MCLRPLGADGSGKVAGCPRWIRPRPLAGSCLFVSGRRSRSRGPSTGASGRSPDNWAVRLRQSRVSCAETRPHGGGKLAYRASVAQWKAELVAQRPMTAKLVAIIACVSTFQGRLSGAVHDADGRPVCPKRPAWNGRNKPNRGDRRWVQGWSPEQISRRPKVDFPDDETMRISHEAIYVQSRGALRRELVGCLRTGRALRAPRAKARRKVWAHVTPEVTISARPTEVEDRPSRSPALGR